MGVKSKIKKNLPSFILNWYFKVKNYCFEIPDLNKINLGDFDRKTPFSKQFGYDRGGPIDRYYIEKFLQKESYTIKGNVLEIGDNEYTLKFGGERVDKSDVLHIDQTNKNATYWGDLSNAPHLPNDTFDCVILTQTLHLIYDFESAINTCIRVLKPGGILLLTSPGITSIDRGEWANTWYWSFTDKSINEIIKRSSPNAKIEVLTYGNVFVASAFLYGIGISEVSKEKLDFHDPHYQVIITAKAVKE